MASSLPQYYDDSTFSSQTSSPFHGSSLALSSYLNNYYGSFNTSSNHDSIFSPQLLEVSSDVSVPEYNNHYKKMDVNNHATQYFHGGDQDYNGFSLETKSLFHPSTEDHYWGNGEGGGSQADHNTKIGRRYTVEERKDRIMRYLRKKNKRNFNKTIKYVCRKTLADRRVRVRGRFVRNNDICEQQSPMSNNHNNYSEKDEDILSHDYVMQMENENGWLHEAMSNLVSFPCDELDPRGPYHPNMWSF